MDSKQFIGYIVDKYTFEYESGPHRLDDVSLALIRNTLDYIDAQEFVDTEDARVHLWSLLDGAFGLERWEVNMYRSDADYPLIIRLLVGEDRIVRDMAEELQYAVDCIHGHEESEPIANHPVQEEIEMSCGCILDEQSRPMHSCWAGLWLDDRRDELVEGFVFWHDPAWSADEFVAHVKEIIAERGLD